MSTHSSYKNAFGYLQKDPGSSYWLKESAISADKRDPVDALNDAELLVALLKQRLDELMPAAAPALR